MLDINCYRQEHILNTFFRRRLMTEVAAASVPAVKLFADYAFTEQESTDPALLGIDEIIAEGNSGFSLKYPTFVQSALHVALDSLNALVEDDLALSPAAAPSHKFFIDSDASCYISEEEQEQEQPEEPIYISSEDDQPVSASQPPPLSLLLPASSPLSGDDRMFLSQQTGATTTTRRRTSPKLHTTRSRRFDPRQPRRSTPRLSSVDQFWFEMMNVAILQVSLAELVPPSAVDALPARTLNGQPFYNDTDAVGQYLIRRGFPLLGKGTSTLTFLLTSVTVAKVPRYNVTVSEADYDKHRGDRNYDIVLHQRYPTCVAHTRMLYTRLDTDDDEHNAAWTEYHPCFSKYHHSFYVQERLRSDTITDQPLNLDSKALKRDPNYYMLAQMHIDNPPGAQFKQWARSYPKTMTTYTSPGIEEEVTNHSWLLLFDHE
jgi:hypothetical protein